MEIVRRIATGFYLVKNVKNGLEYRMSIDFIHPLPESWNKKEILRFVADVQKDYVKMITWENLFED